MLTDSQVLSALRQGLPAEDLSIVVERINRLPEIWPDLHDEAVLSAAVTRSAQDGAPARPADFAFAALGIVGRPDLRALEPELRTQIEASLQDHASSQDSASPGRVGRHALALMSLLDADGGTKDLIDRVKSEPGHWRAALACAWPYIAEQEVVLRSMITSDEAHLATLAACLLSNMPAESAADFVAEKAPDLAPGCVERLHAIGERAFAESLARNTLSKYESQPESDHNGESVADLVDQARAHCLVNGPETAQPLLERAWEQSAELRARVADRLAEVAASTGDPVTSLEARHQALSASPSAERRALVAVAALACGKHQEALSVLSAGAESLEEQIALGLVHLATHQAEEAERDLTSAADGMDDESIANPHWLGRLAHALREVGHPDRAAHVCRRWIERTPSDGSAHLALAGALQDAGDHETAVARLEPLVEWDGDHRQAAQQALAESLMALGRFEDAITPWQEVSRSSTKAMKPLIDCALKSGRVGLAKEQAARWLALAPDQPAATVAYSRTLTASGEPGVALEHLERASQTMPDSADVWLALAEAHDAAGDSELAGQMLAKAAQVCPTEPQVLQANGRWLSAHGRLSEAMSAYEAASKLAPQDPEFTAEYGDLLRQLGHTDQALDVLSQALSAHPSHFGVKLTKAVVLEDLGEHEDAVRHLADVPESMSPISQTVVGRVLTHAAAELNDSALAERGLDHLEQAGAQGSGDPTTAYWLAEATRLTGHPQEAIEIYQACRRHVPESDQDLMSKVACGTARAAIESQQSPLAVSVLEDLRSTQPENVEALVLLSKAYRVTGLVDEALGPAGEAARLAPGDKSVRNEIIQAAVQAKAFDAAQEHLEAWIKDSPDDVEPWLQMADLSAQRDQPVEARAAVAKAMWQARKSPSEAQQVAARLADLGQAQPAVQLLKHVHATEPDRPGLLRQLAESSDLAHDDETSWWAWDQLAQKSPEDKHVLARVGESLWRLSRRAAAIGYFQRALSRDPEDVDLHVRLAQAHLANGDIERGIEHYESAVQGRPDDARLTAEAAKAMMKAGHLDQAAPLFRRAIQLMPDDQSLKLALADCQIEAGDPTSAKTILADMAAPSDEIDASIAGRLALVEFTTGDIEQAAKTLDRVADSPLTTGDQAAWYARANMALGRWQQAAVAIEHGLGLPAANPETALDLLQARVAMAEAAWIMEQAHSAHSPKGLDQDSLAQLRDRLEELQASCVDDGACRELEHRLDLVSQPITKPPEAEEPAATTPGNSDSQVIAHLRADQPDQAVQSLAVAASSGQSTEWSPFLAGIAHTMSGRAALARRALGAASANPALKPLAAYLMAKTWQIEGNLPEAITSLNTAVALWPDEPAWHFELGGMYLEAGQADTALPHLQRAAELDPDQGEYNLAVADLMLAGGRPSEAEPFFSKGLAEIRERPEAWRRAAQAALACGDASLAGDRFEEAIKQDPEDALARIGAAHAAFAMGDSAKALEQADRAAKLDPENPEVQMGWADLLAGQGKIDKALATYQKAQGLMVDPNPARRARARLFLRSNRPEAAVLELKALVDARPEDDEAWASLAAAYETTGSLDEARGALQKALEVDPGSIRFRTGMARLNRKTGQLDQALSDLTYLQTQSPDDPDLAYEMGRVHESRRDPTKALDAYERAIALDRNHAEAHFHAGLVLKALKAYEQAADMFKRAVDLNPHDASAHHQLAAVRALELVHGGIQQATAVSS